MSKKSSASSSAKKTPYPSRKSNRLEKAKDNGNNEQLVEPSQPVPGPSREEFNKLSDTVNEMLSLLKQNANKESRETQGTTKPSDACASSFISNVFQSTLVNDSNTQPSTSSALNDQVQQPQSLNAQQNVQETIGEFIQDLTNGPNTIQSGENKFCELPGRPLDLKISDRIKQKIWACEYVDLNTLLDNDDTDLSSYTIVSNTGEPLRFGQTKSKPTIQGLGQWCSAFEIYLTIYCKKFPNDLPKIMTYMKAIKFLAHKDGDFITYDKEFRYLRQTMSLSWDTIHSGLWLECRDSKKKSNKQNNSNNFRPQSKDGNRFLGSVKHPIGYCYRFHSFGKCGRQSCKFNHGCYKCNDNPHSFSKCPNANNDKIENTNKQSNKSVTNTSKTQ